MRTPPRVAALASAGGTDGPVRPLTGGDTTGAWRVGDVVVKHAPSAPPHLFHAEAAGLRLLRGAGAPVPAVRHVADDGLVLEFVPQGRPDWPAVGRSVAALHRVPQPRYGTEEPLYLGAVRLRSGTGEAWTPFYRDLRLVPLLDEARRPLGALYDRARRWLDTADLIAEGPCTIHGDLWSGNLLHGIDGPVFIDPSAHGAERGLDLAMMALFGGFPEAFWRTYQAAFPVPEAIRRQLPAYRLTYLLVHVLMFGPGYVDGCRRALDELGA